MLLATAIIPGTDLARLVESITPFRVTIDEKHGRAITLDHPTLELVSGEGIRLRGSGLVSWDFAHVPIPVRINAWQFLFVPRVASDGSSHVLSLEPRLEKLDVAMVPGLVDGKIAGAIRRAVAQHQNRLAWDFGRTLSKRLPLPAKVSPTSTFAIFPVGGEASVDAREVRLVLRFEALFELEPKPGAELGRTAAAEHESASAPEHVSGPAHLSARPPSDHPLPRKRPPPTSSKKVRRPAPLRGGRIV